MKSLDRLFDVFSKERRRYALYVLDQADGPMEIEDLAERVRQREAEKDGATAESFEDVVLALEHSDIPKAEHAEYVEYDRSADRVRISSNATEFEIVLRVSEAIENVDEATLFDRERLSPEELLSELSNTRLRSD